VTGARYLLRFDDVCATMDWTAWAGMERVLSEHGIKPIVAVIPDNRDPEFMTGPADPAFWERVRRWQAAGWGIGVHGFEHRRLTEDAGVMGVNARSEFAGLGPREQRDRLAKSLAIFSREGVKPDAWVAPWHSFDETTQSVLRELGVRVISDGFSVYPYRDRDGTVWVPQQLWRLRRMPFGVWTVCLHHRDWSPAGIAGLSRSLAAFSGSFLSLREAVELYGGRGPRAADILMRAGFPWLLKARSALRRR
jgi:predicted deacetylase